MKYGIPEKFSGIALKNNQRLLGNPKDSNVYSQRVSGYMRPLPGRMFIVLPIFYKPYIPLGQKT
jgi:hypothetical protein